MNQTRRKRRIWIAIPVILILAIAGIWITATVIYNQTFNHRCESYEPYMFYVDDFEGLQSTKYQFPSNNGQIIIREVIKRVL